MEISKLTVHDFLPQKESTIQMLAEVSAALLQLYNGEKAKKSEHNPEVDDLKEEARQYVVDHLFNFGAFLKQFVFS